jgi:hypothetical protein
MIKNMLLRMGMVMILPLVFFNLLMAANGSGNTVTEKRNVGSFTRVDMGDLRRSFFFAGDNLNPDNYQTAVIQGEQEGVTVEGEDNILKELNTDVQNGILYIDFDEPVYLTKILRITVYMKNIEALANSGPGYLYAKGGIKANELSLSVSGSGLMMLAYYADRITVKVSGSGDALLNGNSVSSDWSVSGSGRIKNGKVVSSDNAAIHISGSGAVKMDLVTKYLECGISGSGLLSLSGTADQQSVTISGSGNALCTDLLTKQSRVQISGSGNAEISVSDQLEANISGSGSVFYHGKPVIKSHTSGSGSVTQR